MNEWEVEKELTGKDLPDFDATLDKAVFLMKFTAVIAKKILLVADEKNVPTNFLLDGVEDWIRELLGEKPMKAGV